MVYVCPIKDISCEEAGDRCVSCPLRKGRPTTPQPWQSLTDEDRDRAFQTLPDMLDGFMKKWGWLHFAKAIEDICREKNAATLSSKPPSDKAVRYE